MPRHYHHVLSWCNGYFMETLYHNILLLISLKNREKLKSDLSSLLLNPSTVPNFLNLPLLTYNVQLKTPPVYLKKSLDATASFQDYQY